MPANKLHSLALIIGWEFVNEDKGFSNYKFTRQISPSEIVSYTVRINDVQTESEFYDTLQVLQNILPNKLKRRANKITKNIKPEDISSVVDVLAFAIEEFKSKTTYQKLKEYAEVLNMDIEEMGYKFDYEISKKSERAITALIESRIPMEHATNVGKLKKLEYKIGYFKNHKIS
ncbi:MAG: hypothetical protein RR334_03360 [Clostridia bacterium]